MSPTTRRILIGGALPVVFAAGGAGIGVAQDDGTSTDDTTEVELTGNSLTRASEAALAETGGGAVVDTEVEEGENGYEVEVNLDAGRQVEVQLDAHYAVVGSEENDEGDDGD